MTRQTSESPYSVGQVFAVDLENGSWGAAEVVLSQPDKTCLAALDWFGDHRPSLETLAGVGLLAHDHHRWSPATLIHHLTSDATLPACFFSLGVSKAPVALGEGERRSDFLRQLRLQERWARVPTSARESYKRAASRKDEVELVMTPGGEASSVRVASSKLRIVRPGASLYGSTIVATGTALSWTALDVLSALDELAYDGDDLGLVAYLETRPLIQGLGWWSEAIEALDLGRTHLETMSIRAMPKLSRLVLPSTCSSLNLTSCGPIAVSATENGAHLTLNVTSPTGSLREVSGLDGVLDIQVRTSEVFDCSELLAFPALENVHLADIRSLRSVERLAELSKLKTLSIDTCYDFDADSFPLPATWPHIESLSIEGLRKTAATVLQRRARKDPRLKLRKARTDAWLKANLDNPFRDWAEHHSAGKAKAAIKAFAVAAKAIGANPDDLEEILQRFVDRVQPNGREGRRGHRGPRRDSAKPFWSSSAKPTPTPITTKHFWKNGATSETHLHYCLRPNPRAGPEFSTKSSSCSSPLAQLLFF